MRKTGVFIVGGLLLATNGAYPQSAVFPANTGDLLANGNFELGNIGFSSGYPNSPGNLLPNPTYDVVANPNLDNSYAPSFGDHTTGSGLMLAVNGSGNAADVVWSETISVLPGTTYLFSGWCASWSGPYAPASLRVVINGIQIGGELAMQAGANGQWLGFSRNWNSQSSTQATIQIFDDAINTYGNDFALDDLSFTVPEPSALSLIGSGWLSVLLGRRWTKQLH